MAEIKYELRYLPLFYDDLEEHVMYIANVLGNMKAADNLLTAVEKAILERYEKAESYEQYHSVKERSYPYYRIYVKNYVIYYVIIPTGNNKKIMEVRRILHGRQDRSRKV